MAGDNYPLGLADPALGDYQRRQPAIVSSNHVNFETTHANPLLPLQESFFIEEWSRDLPRGSCDQFGLPHSYATTNSSDRAAFLNDFGDIVGSFSTHETYNGETSGSENHLFAESNEWQTTFEQNFLEYTDICVPEEQWYLCSSYFQLSS